MMSTRFGDAGLKYVADPSKVVAEGSIEKVLAGKQKKKAVRLHKINCRAMTILVGRVLQREITSLRTELIEQFGIFGLD